MLIFEKSVKGRTGVLLDECDVPAVALNAPRRAQEARLPEVSEIERYPSLHRAQQKGLTAWTTAFIRSAAAR